MSSSDGPQKLQPALVAGPATDVLSPTTLDVVWTNGEAQCEPNRDDAVSLRSTTPFHSKGPSPTNTGEQELSLPQMRTRSTTTETSTTSESMSRAETTESNSNSGGQGGTQHIQSSVVETSSTDNLVANAVLSRRGAEPHTRTKLNVSFDDSGSSYSTTTTSTSGVVVTEPSSESTSKASSPYQQLKPALPAESIELKPVTLPTKKSIEDEIPAPIEPKNTEQPRTDLARISKVTVEKIKDEPKIDDTPGKPLPKKVPKSPDLRRQVLEKQVLKTQSIVEGDLGLATAVVVGSSEYLSEDSEESLDGLVPGSTK